MIGLRVLSGSAWVALCWPMFPALANSSRMLVRMISRPGPDRMSPLAFSMWVVPIGFSM